MNPYVSPLLAIQQAMRQACLNVGRDPGSVQLVAVSKTHPAGVVDQVAMAGQHLFGENRVQEAREKMAQVEQPGLQWHLIGPLQRNKVKWAVQYFHMIQSVDSLELALEINRRMPEDRVMPVLLQVNVGGEKQKSGLHPDDLPETVREMAPLEHLSVQGLMTVPPFTEDPQQARPFFRNLAELARSVHNLALPGVSMDTLSMGMSHDFEVAIEEGATLVRIGSSLFGKRGGY